MDKKFQPFHLYNKTILSHGGFRVFRLLHDIFREQPEPRPIRVSRRQLGTFTGLSENSLKTAIDELLELKIIVLATDRPTSWLINATDQYNHDLLNQRLNGKDERSELKAATADSEVK